MPEFQTWLDRHWDPNLSLVDWRRILAASGWAAPTWPERWHGRGLPSSAETVVARCLADFGAIGPPPGIGTALAGPTILEHGSDELKDEMLFPTLTGEFSWCQLFSEPGAGSDLASVATDARRRENGSWIVTGQKVWTTSAATATYGLLLARTDRTALKRAGLSFFVLDMSDPGVEVRPLRQMNGHASFNEVFMSEVVVPDRHRVGAVGDGWQVARTTLAYERRFNSMRLKRSGSGSGLAHEQAEVERANFLRPYAWYPQRAGRVDLALRRARSMERADDPVLRQELMRVLSIQRVSEWTSRRAAAARALGRQPGADGSVGKLSLSVMARQAGQVHSAISGAFAMLAGDDDGTAGVVAEILTSTPAQSIAGGTDEIQKTIIGERILGLPRDPFDDQASPSNGAAG